MAQIWSDEIRVYFSDADIGTAMTSFTAGIGLQMLDITALGDGAEGFISGVRQDSVGGEAMFNNSRGIDAVIGGDHIGNFKAPGTVDVSLVSFLIGTGTGNRAFCGTVIANEVSNPINVKELVQQSFSLQMNGTLANALHYGVKKSITATTLNGTIDNVVESTGGGQMYCHVFGFSASGGNLQWLLRIQDSSDTVSWTTVSTIQATATGGKQPVVAVGTIDRWTRGTVILDADSGSITYALAFART